MPDHVLPLWLANIVLATGGQLAFKAAAGDPGAGHGLARWRHMALRPWIWAGCACYAVEFVLWAAFLSLVPLGLGVLLGSLNIVSIVIAGRLLFHERLTRLHLAGIALVTTGVAIIGAAA